MKKSFLFILLILLTSLKLFAVTTIDPYKNIKYFTLENGMKVYILSDNQSVNTQINVAVNVGTDIENKKNAGISHLLEHLLFRDTRIEQKSYISYMEENGATYINGFTGKYLTEYVATIESKKAYWLVENFSKMLFDKKLGLKDLEIEKGALQIEIGALKSYHTPIYYVGEFFNFISELFPPYEPKIYYDDFSLGKEKKRPNNFIYKKNNEKFTLEQLMNHYDKYYYPSNMVLKIVGNFDTEKMKIKIQSSFGQIKKNGTARTSKLPYNATLSNKPYNLNYINPSEDNYAYVGAKYILDDYKKYLILSTYSYYLAKKMHNLLRDSQGKTYSVNKFQNSIRNAGIVGITFSSLNEEFDSNIKTVQNQIKKDSVKMEDSNIQEALNDEYLYYSSFEHDSKTLLKSVDTYEYLHKVHKIFDKTPYEIFQSINTSDFQKVISDTFTKKNQYTITNMKYLIFPFDTIIVLFIFIFLIIYFYIKIYKFNLKDKLYTQRDVLFTRRLSNRFLSLVKFIFIFFIAVFIADWSEYFLFAEIFGNKNFVASLDNKYIFLAMTLSSIWFMIIFLSLSSIMFKTYYVRMDVTKESLNFVGNNLLSVKRESISEVEKISWSIGKFFTIFGFAFLFFRKLIMVKTVDGKIFYLRTNNANHLLEDILKWKEETI